MTHFETPAEFGADLFCKYCAQFFSEASDAMGPNQTALFYAGFIGAAYGHMAATFGKDNAVEIIETMGNAFKTNAVCRETIQ